MLEAGITALCSVPKPLPNSNAIIRNGQDLCQEQRDAFISAANERARSVNAEPPQSESSDQNDGLDPTDVEDAGYLTADEDPEDDPHYYMSQQHDQEGYDNKSSNFASDFTSDFNGFTDTAGVQGPGYIYTDPSTFESSDCNGNSDTTVVHPVKESETSADELALDTQPKASSKRRKRASKKTASKVPRKSDGRSGRRGSKK